MFNFLGHEYDLGIVDQFVDKNISTSGVGEEIDLPLENQTLEKKIEKILCV